MATTLPLPFQDRVIAVTGASRGTGLALARYLLARGAKVSMAATSEETLAKALVGIKQDIPEAKDRVMTMVCDVSKQDNVEAWINATVAKFGPLVILKIRYLKIIFTFYKVSFFLIIIKSC